MIIETLIQTFFQNVKHFNNYFFNKQNNPGLNHFIFSQGIRFTDQTVKKLVNF